MKGKLIAKSYKLKVRKQSLTALCVNTNMASPKGNDTKVKNLAKQSSKPYLTGNLGQIKKISNA